MVRVVLLSLMEDLFLSGHKEGVAMTCHMGEPKRLRLRIAEAGAEQEEGQEPPENRSSVF